MNGIKQHTANEFVIKPMKRKGQTYYRVIDTYDNSTASLELTAGAAERIAKELNEMRNARI